MCKAVRKKLADSNVKLLSYGVTSLFKDVDKSRKTFEFAKAMGIETIVAEPEEDAGETLDKLCKEYGMMVAIHNHPKPSHYWNPDTVLKFCQGRSERIGACADTGHWMRSGLNPLECLKKLQGRIIEFHFKDLNEAGPKAHDVPWGTGVSDVKGMLTEIHRQKLAAIFYVEYEYKWGKSLPEIAQSIAYSTAWRPNWRIETKKPAARDPELERTSVAVGGVNSRRPAVAAACRESPFTEGANSNILHGNRLDGRAGGQISAIYADGVSRQNIASVGTKSVRDNRRNSKEC